MSYLNHRDGLLDLIKEETCSAVFSFILHGVNIFKKFVLTVFLESLKETESSALLAASFFPLNKRS